MVICKSLHHKFVTNIKKFHQSFFYQHDWLYMFMDIDPNMNWNIPKIFWYWIEAFNTFQYFEALFVVTCTFMQGTVPWSVSNSCNKPHNNNWCEKRSNQCEKCVNTCKYITMAAFFLATSEMGGDMIVNSRTQYYTTMERKICLHNKLNRTRLIQQYHRWWGIWEETTGVCGFESHQKTFKSQISVRVWSKQNLFQKIPIIFFLLDII